MGIKPANGRYYRSLWALVSSSLIIDLGAISGWQNQGQAKAINGAIRKLTGVHGDPNLGVDNYLLTGLETIGVKNNYRPSASTVIDKQLFGYIAEMAHDIQNEIDTADGFNWRKWNEETIAERAIMADTVINAAYLTAIHMNMQSYKDNPENFKKFKDKKGSEKVVTHDGTGNTKLYRAMSQGEYDSVMNNGGKFTSYDFAMEEKWFATTPQNAAQWGSKFYPDGNYRMIEIELPTNSLNQMYHNPHLDGIGPAYSGGIEWLNSTMESVKS